MPANTRSKMNKPEPGRGSEAREHEPRTESPACRAWVLHALPSGSETQAGFLAQSRCSVNFNARGMSK